MICFTKEKYAKNDKSKKNQNALYMIASVSSKRCGSYRMYLKGDGPPQTVMIHLQSCDIFHKQHAKFFATFDTYAGTM